MTWKYFEKENINQKRKKEANIYNIFGHTIVKNVIIEDNYAMIDTGACLSKNGYYGRLTALHYPSFKMISIV